MTRRGAILFEILLSIALFAGAASFALAAMSSVFRAQDRIDREHLALDLARSRLAELEAGLVSLTDLRDGEVVGVGSYDTFGETASFSAADDETIWLTEVRTERTAYAGLTLVELTVREETETGRAGVSVTLRQLVALRESEPDAYETDELLEGLPGVTE